MAPNTNSEDQPRLTAAEAIRQLLVIRALSGNSHRVEIFRRSPFNNKKRRSGRIVCLCLTTPDGYSHVWYERHPVLLYQSTDATRYHHTWRCGEFLPELPLSAIAGELAAITRRAYVPKLVTQIYSQHPLLLASLLKGP